MALVHQETQFVGNPLWDFQPVKTFHFWRDMVVFPNVTDDPAAHVLYMLKFFELILRRISQEGVAIVSVRQNELEQLVVLIWCLSKHGLILAMSRSLQ